MNDISFSRDDDGPKAHSPYKLAEAHAADKRANKTLHDKFGRVHRHHDNVVRLYLRVGNTSAHHFRQIECDGLNFAGALAPEYGYVVRI